MPENSRKNKRGARGSVEDDVNEAKRQVKTSENMADNDNQEKSEVQCRSRVKIIGGAHHERQSHEVLGSPGECSSGKFLYRGSLK